MLRPKPSVGAPVVLEPNPYTGWPRYVKRPKTWSKCLLYAQLTQSSSFGSSVLQWLRRSSVVAWSGFQGATPRFGRPRCQAWRAQWLPSGIVQPVTKNARGGPE